MRITARYRPKSQCAQSSISVEKRLIRLSFEFRLLRNSLARRLILARLRIKRTRNALLAETVSLELKRIEVSLRSQLDESIRSFQRAIILQAVNTIENIVGERMKDPSVVERRFREIFLNSQSDSAISIKISPTNTSQIGSLLREGSPGREIRVTKDPSLFPGDLVIEFTSGRIEYLWRDEINEMLLQGGNAHK